MEKDSGEGKLIFSGNQVATVNYSLEELQAFVSDGRGGQLPTVRRRGRVSHAAGHPDWHPLVSLHPPPFTLVLKDGRRLKVSLENEKGYFQGVGDFF